MPVRITIACPASLRADANQLASCLGLSAADDRTFGAPVWKDAAGNLYACASHDMRDEWPARAKGPLARPAWSVNLTGARRAQALVAFDPASVTAAMPGRIAAVAGLPGHEAVAAMGLVPVEADQ